MNQTLSMNGKMIFLSVLFFFSSVLMASELEKAECTPAAIKEARQKFKTFFDQKEYAKARGVYDDMKCISLKIGAEKFYEIENDRALSFSKEGNYHDCLKILAPETQSSQGYSTNGVAEKSAVAQSLNRNMEMCEKQMADEFAKFNHTPCPLKGLPEYETSVQISISSCLILQNAKTEIDAEAKQPQDFKEVCPLAVLVEKSADGLKLTTLLPKEGPLADATSCCALEEMGYKEEKGMRRVEVHASSARHSCIDPEASSWKSQAIYQIKNESLDLEKDLKVDY